MKKPIILFALLLLSLVVCALFLPWQSWGGSIPRLLGITPPQKFAKLQVTSLSGEIEIFVDSELKGSVGPEGSPFIVEDVQPGQRLVKLQRKGLGDQYIKFERALNFSEDVDTVVAYELGPTGDFSQGHVITGYRSYANGQQATLNITTMPNEAEILLDGQIIGTSPLNQINLDLNNAHELKIQKSGYETQNISLLPEDSTARLKLQGYDLSVEASLFLVPLKVE